MFNQSKPWERRHLESKGDFCNLRLNETERQQLNELKDIFRCDQDSTIFKQCLQLVHGNVTQSQSNKAFFQWLSNARRVRPGPKII